jgi:hypothetical protein
MALFLSDCRATFRKKLIFSGECTDATVRILPNRLIQALNPARMRRNFGFSDENAGFYAAVYQDAAACVGVLFAALEAAEKGP